MAERHQSFAILGIGKFGMALTEELVKANQDVLVVDSNEEKINEAAHMVTRAVIADATDQHDLEQLRIDSFDHVYVTLGKNVAGSIMATMLVKQLGATHVVARANNHNHAIVLQKIGADKVVQPEPDLARELVFRQLHPNVVNYVKIADGITLAELSVNNEAYYHRTIADISFRNRYQVNVIAIVGADGKLNQVPQADDVINPHDQITVIGASDDIDRLNDRLSKQN